MNIADPTAFLTPDALLPYWQGHRRLTRRTIQVFPEDQIFAFAPTAPLRTFGAMMSEVVSMIEPTVRGLASGQWHFSAPPEIKTKEQLLTAWEEADRILAAKWPSIGSPRFLDSDATVSSGLPPQPNADYVLYQIDNEIHHRAQGFIYLRLLGVEPPPFHER
jgi:uncharacterized damage-inducible protein DinB